MRPQQGGEAAPVGACSSAVRSAVLSAQRDPRAQRAPLRPREANAAAATSVKLPGLSSPEEPARQPHRDQRHQRHLHLQAWGLPHRQQQQQHTAVWADNQHSSPAQHTDWTAQHQQLYWPASSMQQCAVSASSPTQDPSAPHSRGWSPPCPGVSPPPLAAQHGGSYRSQGTGGHRPIAAQVSLKQAGQDAESKLAVGDAAGAIAAVEAGLLLLSAQPSLQVRMMPDGGGDGRGNDSRSECSRLAGVLRRAAGVLASEVGCARDYAMGRDAELYALSVAKQQAVDTSARSAQLVAEEATARSRLELTAAQERWEASERAG